MASSLLGEQNQVCEHKTNPSDSLHEPVAANCLPKFPSKKDQALEEEAFIGDCYNSALLPLPL